MSLSNRPHNPKLVVPIDAQPTIKKRPTSGSYVATPFPEVGGLVAVSPSTSPSTSPRGTLVGPPLQPETLVPFLEVGEYRARVYIGQQSHLISSHLVSSDYFV